ncbi:hypothetical protein, partial [Mangrovicoccus sp. HB161399]|uniref:hypothetical protein n=1 Tax=Mangrovicoccus sp. HB161399 TaxID=2720392 RepID=UPI001C130B2F
DLAPRIPDLADIHHSAIAAAMPIPACSGLRQPVLGWRRRRLQKIAMHLDSAALASRRDRNLARRTSSATKEPKKPSIGAFDRSPGSSGPLARPGLNSRQSPVPPIDAPAFHASGSRLQSPAACWTPLSE